jgi:hypothetical protein
VVIIEIEILNIFKHFMDLVSVFDLELGGNEVFGEEGVFDEVVFGFDLFLELFGDCVLDGGEFGIDVYDLLMIEGEDSVVKEVLDVEVLVEEVVEQWVHDDHFLPVLHLLRFIYIHFIISFIIVLIQSVLYYFIKTVLILSLVIFNQGE